MDKAWTVLIVAGFMEVIWATAMGLSNGFRIWYYDIIAISFLILSMVLLAKSLKMGLPVGTAYAVWTGIGAVGTIIFSVLLGNESLSVLKTLFVIMILAGIIGLQLTSKKTE